MPKCVLLSKQRRESLLFRDCLRKLSTYDPKWPRERILYALDVLRYDCFVCINVDNPDEMIGAIAFNPDRSENRVKAFLTYVLPEFKGQGIGSKMTAEFIMWAFNNGFVGAQIGLGNSEKTLAVLSSVNRRKNELLPEYASYVEIIPETGVVIFK